MTSQVDEEQAHAELKRLVEEQMQRGNASKRAREVARIILQQGSCTTSDLEALGYKHAPRAVRDLRDSGIKVTTDMESYTDSATGGAKRRARYSITGAHKGKKSRHPFSKNTADAVKAAGRCDVCRALPPLQVDHRVPFEIGGETYPHIPSELMPLCPSCNRTKSWECEHCPNWVVADIAVCKTCMWASPNAFKHVATRQVREIRATLDDIDDIRRFDEQRPDVTRVLATHMKEVENNMTEPPVDDT